MKSTRTGNSKESTTAARLEGAIVVKATISFRQDEVSGWYAARIAPFGLTAHGATKKDAKHKALGMFATLIGLYRAQARLQIELDERCAAWEWWSTDSEKNYPNPLDTRAFLDAEPVLVRKEPSLSRKWIVKGTPTKLAIVA